MSTLDQRREELRQLAFERRARHEPQYGCESLRKEFVHLIGEAEEELVDFYNYCQFAIERCEVLISAGQSELAPALQNWERLRELTFQHWCHLNDFKLTGDD